MRELKLTFIIVGIIFITKINAQTVFHEIGIIAGPVSMQTDYGERGDFASSYGNVGIGAGIVYYIGFDPDRIRWNDRGSWLKNHLRGRLEVSYMKANLVYRGIEASNSEQAILLRGVIGSTKLTNFGGQIEMNLYSATDRRYFEPYFSLGGLYTSYNPEVGSVFGNIEENINFLPNAYKNGIFGKGNTGSLIFGGGARYSLKNNMKLIADFRWQRFFSNKIDGLEPQISEDKFNEWLLFLNIGLAFSLN